MDRQLLKEIFVSALTRHTAQAIGGALTYTGINPADGMSVDSYAMTTTGVLVQLGAFAWSAWRKRRQARKGK